MTQPIVMQAKPVPTVLMPAFPPLGIITGSASNYDETAPVPQPSPGELDKLFWQEHAQMLMLGGLRTSESFVLQETDAYTPPSWAGAAAGSPPASWATREFVEVDEDKWFDVFRRERWMGYNADVGVGKNRWCDVDDDEVWGRLKRVLEIANRILEEAVSHEWLASFLTKSAREARRHVPAAVNMRNFDDATIYRVVPVAQDSRPSSAEARRVLDEMAPHFFWGFHAPDEYSGASGKTLQMSAADGSDGRRAQWMTLDVSNMLPLFQRLTPEDPEGNQVAFLMAIVVLHELMHGISNFLHNEITKLATDRCHTNELFYGEERWAEAGCSFEMSFFGTCIRNHWTSQSPLCAFVGHKSPNPDICKGNGMIHFYDGWTLEDPFRSQQLGIPGILPCAVATSAFWAAHVAKYGHAGLRLFGVCAAEYEQSGSRRVGRARVLPGPYSEHADLDVSVGMVARKLRARRARLGRLRPWYEREYAKWYGTVHGESQLRNSLGMLRGSFSARSPRHEASAISGAMVLVRPFTPTTDLASAEGVGQMAGDGGQRASQWYYQALGFLALAALPVEKWRRVWIDQGVMPYPDRQRPGWKPGVAASSEMLGRIRYLEQLATEARRRRVLHESGRPSHSKEQCMNNARLAFLRWKLVGAVSRPVVHEFITEWRAVRTAMDRQPLNDKWIEFDMFQLPTYGLDPANYPVGHVLQHRGLPGEADQDCESDMPAWAIAKPGVAAEPAANPPPAPRLRYFSPGEIGDRQSIASNDRWVLIPQDGGGEVDIYDVGGFLPPGPWTAAARDQIMEPDRTHHVVGRVLRPGEILPQHLEHLKRNGHIGRAMLWRRAEDVVINDGKDGRPRWVCVGADIFDVTHLQLSPDMHSLEFIFRATYGGDPVTEALRQGYHPDLILEQLRPWKIGWVRPEGFGARRTNRVFTEDEVKWHTNRETGIYVIINSHVFDLTDYCDMHPGGRSILQRYAGTNCTAEWFAAHGQNRPSGYGVDAITTLQGFCIGRVVPQRVESLTAGGRIQQDDEIRIREYIYSRKMIDPRNTLMQDLATHWGTDATKAMEEQSQPIGIQILWDRPQFIFAKVVTAHDDLPRMTRQVLRGMDGAETPGGFKESYISDGRYVYNMTSLLRYNPPSALIEALKKHAGKVMSDSSENGARLRQQFWDMYQHRIIARFVGPDLAGTAPTTPVDWKVEPRRKPGKSAGPPGVGSSSVVGATNRTWAEVLQGPRGRSQAPPAVRPLGRPGSSQQRRGRPPVPRGGRNAAGFGSRPGAQGSGLEDTQNNSAPSGSSGGDLQDVMEGIEFQSEAAGWNVVTRKKQGRRGGH